MTSHSVSGCICTTCCADVEISPITRIMWGNDQDTSFGTVVGEGFSSVDAGIVSLEEDLLLFGSDDERRTDSFLSLEVSEEQPPLGHVRQPPPTTSRAQLR
eukprot:TRINITY_DN60424_c0_g1_i1.p2 TRINITY_DN60424_c0_g1~~TRINITY_DN60424_c0_g1_i1.p2  ORF type:complete len:101 (-),score=17.12 TRINITY_DN60424_c0_g1_i1:358-660(-)